MINLTANDYTLIATGLTIIAQNFWNGRKLSNKPAMNGVFNKLVEDFAEFKNDVKEIKTDVQVLKTDMSVVKTRLDEGEKRMDRMEKKLYD